MHSFDTSDFSICQKWFSTTSCDSLLSSFLQIKLEILKNHKVTLIMDESLFVTVPYIITLQFGHNDRCHYLVTNLLMIIILYHIIKDIYVMGYRHNQLINQVLESFFHFLLLHWIPSNIITKCISNYSLLYGYVSTKS